MNETQAKTNIGMIFGAFADPIADQLLKQGVNASSNDCEHWQKDADAITRLSVRGLITRTERYKADRRLMSRIKKAVK